ncbi:hypothetical protein [Kingella sp. (in: b-proteobacteria)]|uniref:hypothetical protein n=1 Tax=Kingella sp. (in: b-proteobacteria) TaxID=2020713 RepID=UPI0026DBA21D|nr:hypothetical protein [Kingella sp. (in: b-proteobacteria)]MDO4657999.1 hypothetical protein [Kingella sp. (in: b-proteobacteria)]
MVAAVAVNLNRQPEMCLTLIIRFQAAFIAQTPFQAAFYLALFSFPRKPPT